MNAASAVRNRSWRIAVCLAGWVLSSVAVDIHQLRTPSLSGGTLRSADSAVETGGLPVTQPVSQGWEADLAVFREDLRRGRLQRIGALAPLHLATRATDPELNGYLALVRAIGGQTAESKEAARLAGVDAAGRFLARLAESIWRRRGGDLPGALTAAREATRIDAKHPYGWNVLGRAYLESGDRTNALAGFRRAVEASAEFYPGQLNLGAMALESGDPAEARRAFETAVRLEPSAVEPRFGLVLSLEAQGEVGTALAVSKEGVRLWPNDPLLLPKLTDLQMRAGQWAEARTNAQRMATVGLTGADVALANIRLYEGDVAGAGEALSKANDNDPDRHYLDGYRWLASERFPEAQQSLERVMTLSPTHPGALLTLEFVRAVRGQRSRIAGTDLTAWPEETRAMASFLRACLEAGRTNAVEAMRWFSLAEGFVSGFTLTGLESTDVARAIPAAAASDLGLGVLFHSKGMPKSARAALERVLRRSPASSLAHYWLGAVALASGDRAEARTRFEAAASDAPRFFAALYAAGELGFLSGQPAAGASLLGRAQAVRADAGLSLRLGLYHEHMGDDARAEREYREVVRLAPGFFAGHNQLAWFLARRGRNLDEALRLAQRADELQPGNASVLDTLGWIHHLQGRSGPAAELLQRAAQANPQNPTIAYHLAVVLQGLQRTAEARELLQKVLATSVAFPDREAAARLLENLR